MAQPTHTGLPKADSFNTIVIGEYKKILHEYDHVMIAETETSMTDKHPKGYKLWNKWKSAGLLHQKTTFPQTIKIIKATKERTLFKVVQYILAKIPVFKLHTTV